MTKRKQAIYLRDLALTVVKARGVWHPARRGPNMLWFRDQPRGLHIVYRTPLKDLPNPGDQVKRKAAICGVRLNPGLPYGLDIWAPKKVLSVAWSDDGGFELIGYTAGGWEKRIKDLANG